MRRASIFTFTLLLTSFLYSQEQEQSAIEKIRQQNSTQGGVLAGKVRDEKTGEDLIGASVSIINTKLGGSTDIDGRFEIKRIPEGSVDIRVSFIGYETKVITGISVKANEQTTVDVSLGEDQGIQQQEVVISADVIKSGEGAILAERKKAASIGDGISAEQMKRAPDATSGDALKRVTGISVVDNKFIFIRGASERYNGTMLNGASVSSTEVGKKSFAFDMIPASLLENTTVVKSAAPDLPGDFTGGLVQMNTLDFPDTRAIKIGISSGWNSVTSLKDFNSSRGGKNDWMGSDDGTRALPKTMPSDLTQLAQQLPNSWAPKAKTAPMNMSLSLSFGDKYSIDDNEEGQIGYIGAFSYRNSFQRNYQDINALEIDRSIKGTQDNFSVLWGGMLNLSYKFSGLHKVSFKNSYSKTAEDEVRSFSGTDFAVGTENIFLATRWNERKTYSGILSGEHYFPSLANVSANWKVTVSSSRREDPDRKDVTYSRSIEAQDDTPYGANKNQRSWSRLNGRTTGFNADFSLPIDAVKLKFGTQYEKKTTNYDIRYYEIWFANGRYTDSIDTLPIETIYSPDNFGNTGLIMYDVSKATDSYWGDQEIAASYGMADIPFSVFENNFRFTGGARMENSKQNVFVPRSYEASAQVNESHLKNIDILPSANLTCLINDVTNLRFAYSQTINRPEIRELASSGYYDFVTYEIVGGNPNLRRSYIHNYDVRFEIFPEPGEVVAVSYFYKTISGAIEEQLFFTTTRTRSWFNSQQAKNEGYEIEMRKSLGMFGKYFSNFSLSGNYTRIHSEVKFPIVSGNSENTITTIGKRPLQGQSPYMINLSLLYTEPALGTSLTVLYNRFGKRLDAVGFLTSDIYEQPRDIIDASITQPFAGMMELKFTAKNILNKARVLTQQDRIYQRTGSGITYALQFSTAL